MLLGVMGNPETILMYASAEEPRRRQVCNVLLAWVVLNGLMIVPGLVVGGVPLLGWIISDGSLDTRLFHNALNTAGWLLWLVNVPSLLVAPTLFLIQCGVTRRLILAAHPVGPSHGMRLCKVAAGIGILLGATFLFGTVEAVVHTHWWKLPYWGLLLGPLAVFFYGVYRTHRLLSKLHAATMETHLNQT